MNAVIIKNLSKSYKNSIALQDVNVVIKKGDFFGYLGPNGAGKTTTINILTDLAKKSSGKIEILGHDLDKDMNKIKHLYGIVPQEFNFDPFLTNFQTLEYQAGYYGSANPKIMAERLLKEFRLWDKKDLSFRELSGGMKRRLLIARALVHDPPILILDEPTAGVDIELRIWLWDYLTTLHKGGKTIILTTHYLEEAEKLCHTIAIIAKGKIVIHDTKERLLADKNLEQLYLEVTR